MLFTVKSYIKSFPLAWLNKAPVNTIYAVVDIRSPEEIVLPLRNTAPSNCTASLTIVPGVALNVSVLPLDTTLGPSHSSVRPEVPDEPDEPEVPP